MGVKERRDRERAEVRATMLNAVREIAAADGWQTVSIRKVAERTEYSPTLLYQYFESKDAVVHEIRRQGYDDLLARLVAVVKKEADPHKRLVLIARADVELAFEQPEVFKAMLGMDGTPCDPPPDATAHKEIGLLIRECLALLAESSLPPGELDLRAESFFSAIQGVVTMYLNELLPGGRKRALKIAECVADGLAKSWS
jgi:AcrR family transcriptional regulator